MVLKSEKEKVKTLLAETIRLLCKNGLNFKTEFSVEALVGITLDKDEEFFLSIKETVKSDIRPQKLDTPKTQKESHHNGNREIKGEPGQHSSCRKRASETVTNVAGSSELPSLSLGDMQEGEQSFWSSVTGSDGEGAGGEGGTSHPSKRTKVEASEDDSNSNVIEIKGEPGSESEEEDGGGGEASQVDQSGADMSGPYTYATPVTSAHEMIGSGMAQVWDQLPPFSSMPGPSGMAAGMSQDGQQQMLATFPPHSVALGLHMHETTHGGGQRGRCQMECTEETVIRNILLCKGKLSTPRIVTMNIRGRQNTTEILHVMEKLDREGVGQLVKEEQAGPFWYAAPPSRVKAVFLKRPANEIMDSLIKYKINIFQYENRFSMEVKEQENNYNWAVHRLMQAHVKTEPVTTATTSTSGTG